MIDVKDLVSYFESRDIGFFTGVPDSQLSSFCDYIEENCENIIAANEGNALAIATGYNLATDRYPVVYLQNSGLGNIVNPVTSLTHEKVYSIPIIYIIGWRGEPGVHDEPQHIKQGAITPDLLDLLDISHINITKDSEFNELVDAFENRKLESFQEMGILDRYIGTVCHDHNKIHTSFVQSKQAECNFHILRYCKAEYEIINGKA